ncbi:MAG: hypothetical protein Q8L74_06075 [Nitrospirota bacterium]|nr:hypothetical protein [Nitrospirota bacterium]MDP2383597.1 hypothetical protein [Nitrospirota bacterium]MDP3599258.1 hypothetical protein [Nitrospirota bacterium]
MGLRYLVKPWTKVIWLALLMASVGCSQAVLLTHETEQGGVVTYLFKEDRGGPMGSPHRRDAVKLIEKKCPLGYAALKDGEVQGYGSISSVEGAEGDVRGRRWGIQFRCK